MTDNQTPDAEALRHLIRIYWPDSGGQAAVVRDRALQAALSSKIEQHYSDVLDRAEKAEAEVARLTKGLEGVQALAYDAPYVTVVSSDTVSRGLRRVVRAEDLRAVLDEEEL